MKNTSKTITAFGPVMKTALLLAVFLTSNYVQAQDNFVIPADADVFVVTEPPFNADNTGTTDATVAIQAALDSAGTIRNSDRFNLIYIPNGTYLISDELKWAGARTRDVLQGQSRDGVILKLTDNNAQYQDKSASKGMVFTGDFSAPNPGANRFRNAIYNVTFNTGSGNPGATGAKFFANNSGGMFNVLIKSEDGEGKIGLDLGFDQDNGPHLIENVTIQGFDTGIRTSGVVNSSTFRNIRIENPLVVGLANNNQIVSIENLDFVGEVPGIVSEGIAMLTIINSTFTGGGVTTDTAAIVNSNGLFARNITTSGYKQAIDNSGAGTGILNSDQIINEFSSHEVLGLFSSPKQSLNLPITDAPVIPLADTTDWINVTDFLPVDTVISGRTVKNWAPALQQAIDAGKSTVYFPAGQFEVLGEVFIRGNVQRLIGLETKVDREGGAIPIFVVENGIGPVVIERFNSLSARLKIVQQSARPLIIRNLSLDFVEVAANSGDVFVEDAAFGTIDIQPGNHIWARQLNLESQTLPKIINRGSDVWVLGIKTEQDAEICVTSQNGRTEVLGGLIFTNAANNPDKIMFDTEEGSSVSFSIGEFVLRQQPFNVSREARDGFTRIFEPGIAPERGGGSLIPLYTGYRPAVSNAPNAPSNLTTEVLRYNQILLRWEDNSDNEDGFTIQRKEGAGGYEDLDIAFANDTIYSDSTLNPLTTYTYRVRSTNASGQSDFSNESAATTFEPPPAPTAPSNLAFQLIDGIYEFDWQDNASTETGYRIERRAIQDDSVFQVRAVLAPNSTAFSDSLYLGFTDYEYRVIAFLEISDSNPSNVVSFKTGNAVDAIINWSYEEDSGTTAEDGGFLDRDGRLLNGLNFEEASIPGVFGQGIQLDGDEHLVRYDIGNIIDEKKDYPFSLSTWVRTTSGKNQTAVYFGASSLFNLYFTLRVLNGRAQAVLRRFGNDIAVDGPRINDGQWHQVVGVYGSVSRYELYVDGQFIGRSDSTDIRQFVTTGYNFSAGALDRFRGDGNDPDANPTDPFDGSLDETRLFYRELKPREILAEYEQALNQPAPNAPSDLQAQLLEDNSVLLSWMDNSNNEANFVVQRKETFEGTFVTIAELSPNTTAYVDSLVGGFTTYIYRVQAVRGISPSDFTNEVSIITGEKEDPRVHWTMNDSTGTIATDISGNGFNGELSDSEFSFDLNGVEGILGGALEFDGNDKVVLKDGEVFNFSYPFTMSTWVKTSGPGGKVLVFLGDKSRNDLYYVLRLNFSGGTARIEARRGSTNRNASGSTRIDDGEWHLVTGVFESATKHDLYVDGVLETSLSSEVNFSNDIDRFSVGALDRKNTADRFTGVLDDVRLYSRALSGVEILNLYGKPFVPAGPTELTALPQSPFDIQLSWVDNSDDEEGFVIERGNGDSFFTVVDTLVADTTFYVDGGLVPSTEYTYRVAAINAFGRSEYSNEISATTDDLVFAPSTVALYQFGSDSLKSSDAEMNTSAGDFTDGPGLVGGTFLDSGARGVNRSVVTKKLNDAIVNEDYFEFTVRSFDELKFNLVDLSFSAKRTSGGPKKIAVQTSADDFTGLFTTKVKPYWKTFTWDLSGSEFQFVEGLVTFRIYVYGKKPNGSKPWKNLFIDEVTLASGLTTGAPVLVDSVANGRLAILNTSEMNENIVVSHHTKLYPNPAESKVNLQFNERLSNSAVITIHDLSGRLLMTEKIPEKTGHYELNVRSFHPGLFILNITVGEHKLEYKLIKN